MSTSFFYDFYGEGRVKITGKTDKFVKKKTTSNEY